MNKSDLIATVAAKSGLTNTRASELVNLVFDEVQAALATEQKVTISGFGSFEVSTRKAFTGHNPVTKQAIEVPSRKVPTFRAGSELRKALNGE
jgi:DNA-binding protein HU-beta